jgi:hypothetical protein
VRSLALKGFIISQYDESIIFHSSFSLQRLLPKVSYETFYRKHCKEGATVMTQFWVIPKNSLFFKKKIKK